MVDYAIEQGCCSFENKTTREFSKRIKVADTETERQKLIEEKEKARTEGYREHYKNKLNRCIDVRYRQKGFAIFFALIDGTQISDVLEVHPDDKIIYVGMDEKTYKTKNSKGKYTHPNQDYILSQLGDIRTLRVSGLHITDSVQVLAERAYRKGMEVLVDEDLTELFSCRMNKRNFKLGTYPNPEFKVLYKDMRRDIPWLWQGDQ